MLIRQNQKARKLKDMEESTSKFKELSNAALRLQNIPVLEK